MKKELKQLMMITLATGTLAMTSCRETKEDEPAEPMQHEMHDGERMENATDDMTILQDETTAEFKDDATAAVYRHYIDIKRALVQTDAGMAQQRAEEMLAELENSRIGEQVSTAAQNIAASTNVNEQREAFSGLTAAMESHLEGALESGEIYKQYCPMAFEGKGDYWFSNSKEIRNPYYGDKMLKCGRVEATIN